MRDLKGKRVLITGAAQGIGRAIASCFAEQGAELLLTDIDEAALRRAAEQLGSRDRPCRTYRLDVTDLESVRQVRGRVHAEAGPIDVLVNNAGLVFGGSFLDVPLERHRRTYEVNLLGLVAVTHTFLPDLLGRPEAQLINVASASGYIGLPHGTTYASSKWAVIGFSDSLRQELELLGHDRVHVTTVCPGYVDTGLFEGVKPPMFTRMLTPDRLARKVLRAVRGNRRFLLTPWLIKLAPPLVGVLPTWLSDRVSRALGVTHSMVPWQGR